MYNCFKSSTLRKGVVQKFTQQLASQAEMYQHSGSTGYYPSYSSIPRMLQWKFPTTLTIVSVATRTIIA